VMKYYQKKVAFSREKI